MAIEISAKPKFRAPRWAIALLTFCFIAIVLLAGSYVYFDTSSKTLAESVKEKEKALEMTPSERSLEERVVFYEQRINAFAFLLSGHKKLLGMFNFFEETTHPLVWFTEFTYNMTKREVKVSGEAANFTVLGQQLLILQDEQLLNKIILSKILLSTGGFINFSLQIILDPSVFK